MFKYLFLFISLSISLFSEEKKFDDYDNVEKIFQAYIKAVDEKNIEEMSKFFIMVMGTRQFFILEIILQYRFMNWRAKTDFNSLERVSKFKFS